MVLYLLPEKKMNKTISHMPGVKGSVRSKAKQMEGMAKAVLTLHRYTGNAKIEISHGRTDSLISLVDPGGNAMSIEFGHKHWKTGKYIEGIYALRGAMLGAKI